MIECRHINKKYDDIYVIYDRNESFEDTGLYVIFGESGSGKTTFLNILFGILPFDGGEITVGDNTYAGKVDIARMNVEAEYIDQFPHFADFLTVADNLLMVCKEPEKTNSLLERFNLKATKDQMPGTLSGGERQRLAIIRALLQGKKILFLDEPTAALDEENKHQVFEFLNEIKKDTLIICSTHDKAAEKYADHILIFEKDGRAAENTASSFETKTLPPKNKKTFRAKEDITAASGKKGNGLNAGPFLKKRPVFKNRAEAGFLFALFMISFLFLFFADLPQNKMDATKKSIYHCNMLPVSVFDENMLEELAGSDEHLTILDYQSNLYEKIPEMGGGVHMELLPSFDTDRIVTIPFYKKYFYLSDRLFAGTYFTSDKQVILSYETAVSLRPSGPEKLVGKTIKKDIKGLGETELEIVGILQKLSEEEKGYIDQYDIDRNSYDKLYFINSNLTALLKGSSELGIPEKDRIRMNYHIYYSDYGKVLKAYNAGLERDDYRQDFTFSLNRKGRTGLYMFFDTTFFILLPVSILVGLLSVLFAARIQKLRFVYDHHFISVFEQCGYDKKKVIRTYIMLTIKKQGLLIASACVLSAVVAVIVNALNGEIHFMHYHVFTFNILFVLPYIFAVMLVGFLYNIYCFKKVKVLSWYEDLTSARDLI